MSEVIGVSVTVAVALALFIAWQVDGYRRAKLQAAVLERVWKGQSPAVFVDAKGEPVPDEQAPPALHALRGVYEELLESKRRTEGTETKK